MKTVKELALIAKEAEIDIAAHMSCWSEKPRWGVTFRRRNEAGSAEIVFDGPDLEEVLTRGIETITGIALRDAEALPSPKAAAGMDDDIPS